MLATRVCANEEARGGTGSAVEEQENGSGGKVNDINLESGRSVMGLYDLLYRVGGVPWERAGEAFGAEDLERLLRREEERLDGPGTLLDLGCGTGMYALGAAARGWHVVGVDASHVAIERARERAAASGMAARFEVGDVGQLTDLGIPPGSIDLFIDVGCYHGLPQATRRSVGRGMGTLAAVDASALIAGVDRSPRLVPVGTTTADLERNLQGWRVLDSRRLALVGMPALLRRVPFRLFWLRPRGSAL